jgi:hypothetical protein
MLGGAALVLRREPFRLNELAGRCPEEIFADILEAVDQLAEDEAAP